MCETPIYVSSTLSGITQKLSYLDDINVQGIVLSSFYESSTAGASNPDFGYEVTNHTAIAAVYGSMSDFEELLAAAHELGSSRSSTFSSVLTIRRLRTYVLIYVQCNNSLLGMPKCLL